MKIISLLAVVSLFPGVLCAAKPVARPAEKPDVRIVVKAVSEGTDHHKKTDISSRRLEIQIENREQRELSGLQVTWKIAGKDIQSDRKSIVAKGGKTITLGADGKLEIHSDVAKFSKTEGGIKATGRGTHRRAVRTPDTGQRYAGHIVEIKQNGKVIAEASSTGIRTQLK